eukprot:116397_1
MNDIKNKKRNKLGTFMLSCLMMIRLNGPDSIEEFDKIYDIAFDNWYYPGRHDIKTELLDEHFIKITKASKTNSASKAVEFFTLFQDILVDDETYIALGFGDDNEEIDDDGINPTDFNVLDENWSDLDDEVKEEIEEKCIDENDSMDQEDEDIDLDLSEMIQNDYGLSNNSLVHGK